MADDRARPLLMWSTKDGESTGQVVGDAVDRFKIRYLSWSRQWQASDTRFPTGWTAEDTYENKDRVVCMDWCCRQAMVYPTIRWWDRPDGVEGWVVENGTSVKRFLVSQDKDARVEVTDFRDRFAETLRSFQSGFERCYALLREPTQAKAAEKQEPPARTEGGSWQPTGTPEVKGGGGVKGQMTWLPLTADDPIAPLVGGRTPDGYVWEYAFGKYAYRLRRKSDVVRAVITPCPDVQKWVVNLGWPHCESYIRDTLREAIDLTATLTPTADDK